MIDRSILRALVLEVIPHGSFTQITTVINAVEMKVQERRLFPSEEECINAGVDYAPYRQGTLHRQDTLIISEIVWDLIFSGVLVPQSDNANDGFPFIRLTQYGERYIADSVPHYFDPNGYMVYISQIVSELDEVIKQYLLEGINCFRQHLLFAAAVMIGAAAEKCILLLLEAIRDFSASQVDKLKCNKLLDRPNLPQIFSLVQQTIKSLIDTDAMPYSVHRGSTEHLLSLFEMIRVERNDSVHPKSGEVNRTKILLSIQSFPVALEWVYSVSSWLNKPTSP